MNRNPCQDMEALLVDYADGALAGDEATRVGAHLAQCPDCRSTVEALRQSLTAAQTIWRSNLPDVRRGRARRWRYLAAAAGVVLAVGTLLHLPARRDPAPEAPTLAEIESRIAQAGQAARLLARVDHLQRQTSRPDMAENQYRYILDKYPDTETAKSVHRRLESSR